MSVGYSVAMGRYTFTFPKRRGGYFRLYWQGRYVGRRRSIAELRELARIHAEMTRKAPPIADADPRQGTLPV